MGSGLGTYLIVGALGALGGLIEALLNARENPASAAKSPPALAGPAAGLAAIGALTAVVAAVVYYQVGVDVPASIADTGASLWGSLPMSILLGFGTTRLLMNEMSKRALQRQLAGYGAAVQPDAIPILPQSSH